MTVHTTVAFDLATAQRLERLAKRWGVSKSETLRRALEAAEKNLGEEASNFSKMTPGQTLKWFTLIRPIPLEQGISGAAISVDSGQQTKLAKKSAPGKDDDPRRH